jgi:protein kinase C substrate 80K-H
MISWALCLSFLHLSMALETPKTLGVPPNLIAKYVPLKSGNWNCLDGLKQIPWGFVNDDSCDCPDGSDEPGPMFQLNDER